MAASEAGERTVVIEKRERGRQHMTYVGFAQEATLRRVRAEFLEMPGLKLTVPQAQRLWGVDRHTCEAVIEELTASRFLARTRDGAVVLRAATA
jgi:Fic family protein